MVAETVLTMPPTEALTPSAVGRMPSTRTCSSLSVGSGKLQLSRSDPGPARGYREAASWSRRESTATAERAISDVAAALGAGRDRVGDEVALADQGRRQGGPGDGDPGADQKDPVEGVGKGRRVAIDPGREQGAEDGDADGDPDLAEGVVDPRGHAAAGGRDHAEGGVGHGRVGQPDPDPDDQQAGQHDRPGRG